MVGFHVENLNFKDNGNRIVQTPSNMASSLTGSIFGYKPLSKDVIYNSERN